MNVLIAVLVMALVDSVSCILISKGMKQVGEVSFREPRHLLNAGRRMATNNLLVIGFLMQASTFFVFITLLSKVNLSLIVPMAAIGYVFSLLGAKIFLKERVTKERWIGTLIIGAGVTMVLLNAGAN